MRSYTHISGALLFYLIFAYLTNQQNPFGGMFLACWISLFPDIIDRLIGRHRGIGHGIFWLIPFIILILLNFNMGMALAIGFLSHLLLDSFTAHGCPLLYPFRKTNFVCLKNRNRLRTGTKQDKAVFIFLLFLVVPFSLFTTGAGQILTEKTLDPVFASTGDISSQSNSINSSAIKNNVNIYLPVENGVNKNITIQRDGESPTTILIDDI